MSITTLIAYRLRLEKLLYIELSKSPNGFFKPLLDLKYVTVSILKPDIFVEHRTEIKPGNRSAAIKKPLPLTNCHGHYISVSFIQVTPLGYFAHVSITTPIVSALKNYYR
jgi:hypothetical protein